MNNDYSHLRVSPLRSSLTGDLNRTRISNLKMLLKSAKPGTWHEASLKMEIAQLSEGRDE